MEKTLAVACPTFLSTFHVNIATAIRACVASGPPIRTLSASDDLSLQQARLLKELELKQISALIAVSVRPSLDVIRYYRLARVPIILIDERVQGVSSVAVDNRRGGWLAGEHLARNLKRKNLVIISGRITGVAAAYNAIERTSGFVEALREYGPIMYEKFEVIHYSQQEGGEIMEEILSRPTRVDGIFCAAGDICASGLLKVAREKGCKVPDDIAIVGYDNLPVSEIMRPALTTIEQPIQRLAEAAYRLATIEKSQVILEPKEIDIQPKLVVRQSA